MYWILDIYIWSYSGWMLTLWLAYIGHSEIYQLAHEAAGFCMLPVEEGSCIFLLPTHFPFVAVRSKPGCLKPEPILNWGAIPAFGHYSHWWLWRWQNGERKWWSHPPLGSPWKGGRSPHFFFFDQKKSPLFSERSRLTLRLHWVSCLFVLSKFWTNKIKVD